MEKTPKRTASRREICLDAVKRSLGNVPNPLKVSQDMIESGISRVGIILGIEMSDVPESTIKEMAESACWFVNDNDLQKNPTKIPITVIREKIAEYLVSKFTELVRYTKIESQKGNNLYAK